MSFDQPNNDKQNLMLASTGASTNGKTHVHHVFGLNVESQFRLPELLTGSLKGQPSIKIKLGVVSVPENNLPNTIYSANRVFNDRFFYLNLPGAARYLAEQESSLTTITIEVIDQDQLGRIKSWLYGSVLTAALQMNNRFAIHASAILDRQRLVLFCGPSGIGKSTLASQLHSRGYSIFSDDKCVLHWNQDQTNFEVYPSLKIARLWQDATQQIDDISFLHSPQQVDLDAEKFQYLLDDEVAISESMPVKAIFRILNGAENSELGLTKPKGMVRIKQLINQTHRLHFVRGLGKQRVHWEHMEAITQEVPFYFVRRPKETPIKAFVDFVEEKIATL